MNYEKLAELLFPHITKTPADWIAAFPPRVLPEGAKVTRLAPSPTGFIHLGNLYGAFTGERLAHQSEGVFFLRIEDTDNKREVEGAVEAVISSLAYFNVRFDEGALGEMKNGKATDVGAYGPYYQSDRAEIYQTFAKQLVREGKAYPCFASEEELAAMRETQEAEKANPGYHGKWAVWRDRPIEEIEAELAAGKKFTLRFRSEGIDISAADCKLTEEEKAARMFTVTDGIRGRLTMPENYQDVVLLKQNGIPTYHFAHVIDDHLMGTTHVVRGEEWLSSLPIHVQIFSALGWEPPVFCHTTVLMKMDGDTKRKLSKRKDPELSLNYYRSEGYHPDAVREYLLTILNSNFEEWRIANPDADWESFRFTTEKMSSSGTLFDLNKLNDVSKDVLVRKPAEELYAFLLDWAERYGRAYDPKTRMYCDPEDPAAADAVDLYELFRANEAKMLRILSIDRTGEKPRKDLVYAKQIVEYFSYFFDETFVPEDTFPEEVPAEDIPEILEGYLARYYPEDDNSVWFDKVRSYAEHLGYAGKPKDFKKNPELYKGHVGHVSTVIRVAVTGRRNSPDLWTIQQIMGEPLVQARIKRALGTV
jgi:glutamyl-tRNA synthetase